MNLPGSRKIAVVDRKARSVLESWDTGGPLANYPMALDERDHRLFVVTRLPARLIVLDTDQGKRVATLPAIGDCDYVFYDERRHRLYAIGGEGGISVFQQRDADHYDELGRSKTVSGARTGFFSAEFDKLYLAVRKHESQPAEIRVYTPMPSTRLHPLRFGQRPHLDRTGFRANATGDNERLLCRCRIPDKPNIPRAVVTEHQKHLEAGPCIYL